jgi:hypothetical protein
MTIGLHPNLFPKYWIDGDSIGNTQQYIRSPDGEEYMLVEDHTIFHTSYRGKRFGDMNKVMQDTPNSRCITTL